MMRWLYRPILKGASLTWGDMIIYMGVSTAMRMLGQGVFLSYLIGFCSMVLFWVVDPLCRIFWYNHLGGKEKYERRYGRHD
jgi:hypothetical protein